MEARQCARHNLQPLPAPLSAGAAACQSCADTRLACDEQAKQIRELRSQVATLAGQMAAMARHQDRWDRAASAVDDLRSVLHEHSARRDRKNESRARSSVMSFLTSRNRASGSRPHPSESSTGVLGSLRSFRDRGRRRVSQSPPPPRPPSGSGQPPSSKCSSAQPAGHREENGLRRPPQITTDRAGPADPSGGQVVDVRQRRQSFSPNRLSMSPQQSILRRQGTSPPALCLDEGHCSQADSQALGRGGGLPPLLLSLQAQTRSEKRMLPSPPGKALYVYNLFLRV